MFLRQKIREDTFIKMLVSFIAVVVIVYVPSYGKLVYNNMKVITSEILEDGHDYTGYQAGEGIVSVKSVEEINNNRYFTIEVAKKDIVETGYYVEDINSGDFYQIGQIKKYFNKVIRSVENDNLAQFCVVTLQSGEKCIVLIDTDLINVNTSKTIKLPIGEKDDRVYPSMFSKIASSEGVSNEECEYFMDTTCYDYYMNPKLEQLASIKGWGVVFVFIITYVIFTKLFKKLGYESEVEMIRNLFK
jgi:hypothetical protein